MPSDGFAVLATEKGVLRISGTNPRGCIYGVYDLLERYGGVGFYSSWCEKVPRLDRLAVPAMSVNMSAPAFEMREPFWYDVNVHLEFGAKHSDAELREDPEAVELAKILLKDKADARGPMTVKEWGDAERLAGWREIAKGQ